MAFHVQRQLAAFDAAMSRVPSMTDSRWSPDLRMTLTAWAGGGNVVGRRRGSGA